MKYAILGEESSDAETVKVLVMRLFDELHASLKPKKLSFKPKGYGGWGKLCKNAARDIRALNGLGFHKFIICVDADGPDPATRKQKVHSEVVKKSGLTKGCCLVIPVQEIEAWILADVEKVSEVISSWKPQPLKRNPEHISSPKEYLKRLSKDPITKKERYDDTWHNERVAQHLRLEKILDKCKSFHCLADFIGSK